MATFFYSVTISDAGSNTINSGVGAASGAGTAFAYSTAPGEGAGSASGTSTAVGVGAYSSVHHIAQPRPAPGETNCDC